MNAKLTILAGIPGAGKTSFIENHAVSEGFDSIYDDYYATQIKDTEEVKNSKNPAKNTRFFELINDLSNDKHVVVADIVFCIAEYRNSFIAAVVNAVPDVQLDFIFFKNNPEASRKNINSRNRSATLKREFKLIDEITKRYSTITVKELDVYDS